MVFSPGSQAPLTMARRCLRMLSAASVLILVAVAMLRTSQIQELLAPLGVITT